MAQDKVDVLQVVAPSSSATVHGVFDGTLSCSTRLALSPSLRVLNLSSLCSDVSNWRLALCWSLYLLNLSSLCSAISNGRLAMSLSLCLLNLSSHFSGVSEW